MRVPLIAIDFDKGFHIIAGTDHNESMPSDPVKLGWDYHVVNTKNLRNAIKNRP